MNYNQNYNNEQHPEHPVRNVFFCIYCFFFSLAFSYLWVCPLFQFEYAWLTILVASLILVGSIAGAVISFKRSHNSYFVHRKLIKYKRYR